MNMTPLSKKVLAVVAAGLLSFASAPVALAQTTPPGAETSLPPATPAQASQIDLNKPVTLNIYKKIGDPQADLAAAQGLTGLAGVEFQLERIDGVDLTTQAGWDELATLTATNIGDNTANNLGTITTDANGFATVSTDVYSEFKAGVYRVTELEKDGYSVAAPFLITLPYNTADGWSYTRDIYPKNQQVTPNKQVDDTG